MSENAKFPLYVSVAAALSPSNTGYCYLYFSSSMYYMVFYTVDHTFPGSCERGCRKASPSGVIGAKGGLGGGQRRADGCSRKACQRARAFRQTRAEGADTLISASRSVYPAVFFLSALVWLSFRLFFWVSPPVLTIRYHFTFSVVM